MTQDAIRSDGVDETAPRPVPRCRRIEAADLDGLAALLARGFPARSRDAWRCSLARLDGWTEAARLPGLGLVLTDGERLVGCLLTIYSADGRRCNLSSWYAEEGFRRFASLLVNVAIRDRSVTYLNVSSERHTRPIIAAQGFRPTTVGVVLAIPLLSRPGRASVSENEPAGVTVDRHHADLLAHHVGFGCLAFWVVAGDRAFPFVVVRRRVGPGLPLAQLVFSAAGTDWRLVGSAVGRALARHGLVLLLLDAAGPVPGLAGRFLPGRMPKYARGPRPPACGDLAYTEIALIGT